MKPFAGAYETYRVPGFAPGETTTKTKSSRGQLIIPKAPTKFKNSFLSNPIPKDISLTRVSIHSERVYSY
jgi:hypothetical protein